MNDVSSAPQGRGRKQLVLLIVLFLLPPLAAWFAFNYLQTSGVSKTTNYGTFIRPARQLDLKSLDPQHESLEERLQGRWVYVHFADRCDAVCEKQLYATRQIRSAVSKDTIRVKRLLVLNQPLNDDFQEKLRTAHTDLRIVQAVQERKALLEEFESDQFSTQGDQFFLVDPLGNLMMYYASDAEPRLVLKDLKKLLKISQVG